jgi:hypothetical protein
MFDVVAGKQAGMARGVNWLSGFLVYQFSKSQTMETGLWEIHASFMGTLEIVLELDYRMVEFVGCPPQTSRRTWHDKVIVFVGFFCCSICMRSQKATVRPPKTTREESVQKVEDESCLGPMNQRTNWHSLQWGRLMYYFL